MSDTHRCNYKKCRNGDAEPKFTRKLNQTRPKERQPVWRCEEHWTKEPEVGAISGHVIKRRFRAPMIASG